MEKHDDVVMTVIPVKKEFYIKTPYGKYTAEETEQQLDLFDDYDSDGGVEYFGPVNTG